MPLVQITMWEERDSERKAELIKDVTESVSKALNVLRENWGVGGIQASKKDWGY